MKVLIIVSALFVGSQAAAIVYGAPPIISTGGSTQYNSADSLGNYNFGYDEGHLSGGSFRKEAGDAYGNKYGSYGLTDADGRTRIVNYVADADGFRADIKSNEPGLEPKDPASTTINKAPLLAPAVTYAHPAPIAYAAAPVKGFAAAPIAYAATPAKGFAAAPIAYAAAPIQYAAAPIAYAAPVKAAPITYAVAPAPFKSYAAPFSYVVAPSPIKTYAAPVAHAPLVTYAAAPAPIAAYAAAPFYKGTPFYKPAIAV